jgi:hypothetical protein
MRSVLIQYLVVAHLLALSSITDVDACCSLLPRARPPLHHRIEQPAALQPSSSPLCCLLELRRALGLLYMPVDKMLSRVKVTSRWTLSKQR